MNVYVFKTTVHDHLMVAALKPRLDELTAPGRWNFDLNDCDRILRVETPTPRTEKIIACMRQLGVVCEELED